MTFRFLDTNCACDLTNPADVAPTTTEVVWDVFYRVWLGGVWALQHEPVGQVRAPDWQQAKALVSERFTEHPRVWVRSHAGAAIPEDPLKGRQLPARSSG